MKQRRISPKTILWMLLLLCPYITQAQKLISEKKLRKDFDAAMVVIEAHPDPYRHMSTDAMQALIDSTRTRIDHPMDVVAFYKLLSPVYALIRDGHTSVYPPVKTLKKIFKEKGVFPYKVHLTDQDEIYLIKNFGTDDTVPMGSKVLTMHGMSVKAFIDLVDPYICYEQTNFRNSRIEDSFDFYLMLAFGQKTEIEITYLASDEQKHIVPYIAYDLAKKKKEDEDAEKQKLIDRGEPYAYTQLTDGVGLLTIHSFATRKFKHFEFFLRRMFKEIKKDDVQSLIIDVRGNLGGFPKASSNLFHYLTQKHFKTLAISDMKVSQSYLSFFERFGVDRNSASRSWAFSGLHTIDLKSIFLEPFGTIVREDALYNEEPKKKSYEFKGDLYLLTDKKSFSASSCFAATFKCYQMGLIIGEETGGTGVFHANSMFKKLERSNVVVRMSTCRMYTTCFNEADEGIMPDIIAKPTVMDLINDRDGVLEYTLRVIRKLKKKNK